MTISRSRNGTDRSINYELSDVARYYLGGRRGVLVLAIIVAPAGIGFSWNWLIAAGIAPVVVAVLPCLVMCGLGLCMNKLLGKSCASGPPTEAGKSAATTEPTSMQSQSLNERRNTHA
jgi:hypothetical protein